MADEQYAQLSQAAQAQPAPAPPGRLKKFKDDNGKRILALQWDGTAAAEVFIKDLTRGRVHFNRQKTTIGRMVENKFMHIAPESWLVLGDDGDVRDVPNGIFKHVFKEEP